MPEILAPFAALPGHGIAALFMVLAYALQSEVRFGARARSSRMGPHDKRSTLGLSFATLVPVLGFALALKANSAAYAWLPPWFKNAALPGVPVTAWAGVVLGALGILLRLWAVLTLRHRYTRTLLIHTD